MNRVKLKKEDLVVVKVGTSTLLTDEGKINDEVMTNLVKQLSFIKKEGFNVLLVSSGAVGFGRCVLNNYEKVSIDQKQAIAAVGQVAMMDRYTNLFAKHDINVGQILLVNTDIANKHRAYNAKNTFNAMQQLDVLPIVNENDSTVVAEIKVGDNDNLSALVSILLDASLLILLSDIDGLYSDNPNTNPNAKKYEVIEKIDNDIMKVASGTGSSFGTGGMQTKLEAAFKVTNSGIPMVIANGSTPDILIDIVKDNFEGTYFKNIDTHKNLKKKWLGFLAPTNGSIMVDDGAKKALLEGNASLLVPGITSYLGEFVQGDIVAIYDNDRVLLGKGIAKLSAQQLKHENTGVFLHKDNISLIEE